jgi:hypothetical protein
MLSLLAVAVPVGVVTGEMNFMITNVLLAASFLVMFEPAALLTGLRDPLVAAVVVWCLLWPPLHAILARRLRFSPSKLAGWGMYAQQEPRIDIVTTDGALKPLHDSQIAAKLLHEFGACRIGWLRRAAHAYFFRWRYAAPAAGVVFRWLRYRGDRFVTSCVIVQGTAGASAVTLEIVDGATAAEFTRLLTTLARRSAEVATGAAPAPVVGTSAVQV